MCGNLFTAYVKHPVVRRALLLVLALAFAGCSDQQSTPEPPTEQPPAPVEPEVNQTIPTTWFNLTLSQIPYSQSVTQLVLDVQSLGRLGVTITGKIGALAQTSNCAVGAMHAVAADNTMLASGGTIFWAAGDAGSVGAMVAGEAVEVGSSESSGPREPYAQHLEATLEIRPGDRLLVELGGQDPKLMEGTYEANGTQQANYLNISLEIDAVVELVQSTQRVLRCGSGAGDFDEHEARVDAPGMEASKASRLHMTTASAATLVYVNNAGAGSDFNKANVTFLGEQVDSPDALVRTAGEPGSMGIVLDSWASTGTPAPLWLVADLHWPFVMAL